MINPFAVIFDMDGVIVDNADFHLKAWNVFLTSLGVILGEDARKKVFGKTNKEHLEFFFGKSFNQNEIHALEDEKELIYRDLYRPHIKPVNGLVKFLNHLRINHVQIALASSAPRVNIDFVFENTGIGHYFSIVLDASSVMHGKPDPEIYNKAMHKICVSPDKCIIIEDSISGILAARASGAKVIGITTTHSAAELPIVDLIIPDFVSLTIPALEKLF